MAREQNTQSKKGGDQDYNTSNIRGVREEKGIVIGTVKANAHPARMGNLMVFIDTFSNQGVSASGDRKSLDDDPSQWRLVKYCTPFYSRAAGSVGLDNDEIDVKNTAGFVYPCPDIGTKVLCFFPSGKTAEGFWFASIPDPYMMQSLPEPSMTTNFDKDSNLVRHSKAAAGEFNDKRQENDPKKIKNFLVPKRAISKSSQTVLKQQGLDRDEIRGLSTSSYMRETPSELVGLTTKGRRVDQNGTDISQRSDILQSFKESDARSGSRTIDVLTKPLARKRGHALIMDDGDLEGNNNLVRIRTANGHQLLLHDTEDLVYIANAKGTAWVQFDGQGQVDLYSSVNVNIRSKNINFHADDSIRMHAGRTVQIVAEENMHVEGGKLVNLYSDQGEAYIYGGRGIQAKGSGKVNIEATGDMSIRAGSNVNVKGSCIALQGPAAGAQKQNKATTKSLKDTKQDSQGFWNQSANVQTSVDRAPSHEPYSEHKVTTQPSIYESATFSLNAGDNNPVFPALPPQVKDTGIETVLQEVNNERIAETSLALQPNNGISMGILDSSMVTANAAGIVELIGSDFAYDYIDPATNALGKFAFTVEDLQKSGFVRPEAFFNGQLTNPRLWTGKNGVSSLPAFLQNSFEQESLFTTTLFDKYQEMSTKGIIKETDSAETVSGLLTVAYAVGADQAKRFREGTPLEPRPIPGTQSVETSEALTNIAKKFFKKGVSAASDKVQTLIKTI